MHRDYNYIYSKIVEDRSDIIGHIAYALYKSDKIDFIESFKEEFKREPEEDDLKIFHITTQSDASVANYRKLAVGILRDFVDNTTSEMIEECETDIRAEHLEMVRNVLDEKGYKPMSTGKSYARGIFQSAIGAFLFMLIMCFLLFLLNFSDKEWVFRFGGSGNAKIEEVGCAGDSTAVDRGTFDLSKSSQDGQ